MAFEQDWLEYDYNPFILFNSNGKVLSLNNEAQYLLGVVSHTTIFELASSYASSSYGFKTSFFDLEYGRFHFFGITVGYENEQEIGIKLYKKPSLEFKAPQTDGEATNIYTILDLCINTNSIGSQTTFTKDLDPTIPDIKINTSVIIKLLNLIYKAFEGSEKINTRLSMKVGEYIRYEDKKFTLFNICISGDTLKQNRVALISQSANEGNFNVEILQNKIQVSIPIIL